MPLLLVYTLYALLAGVSFTQSTSTITISSLHGCLGLSGQHNVIGCAAGMTLTIAGSGFHLLDYTTEAAVAVGDVYLTCHDATALSAHRLLCTLPRLSFQPAVSLPVFVFNRSSGYEYTDRRSGVQYGVPILAESSSPRAPSSDTSSSSSSCSSSTGSAKPPPHISSISGSKCTAAPQPGLTLGCSTNSPTLFTVSGSGFDVATTDGVPVQLRAANTSGNTYFCGASEQTNSTIICMILQPPLDMQDSGAQLRVTVRTDDGESNGWYVQLFDDGPYEPQAPSSHSATIAGVDAFTFIVVVTSVGVVVLLVAVLAVLSFCCGVSLSFLRCGFRSSSSSSSSSPPAASISTPLLADSAA